jgi:hypothetical protein
MPSQSAIWAGLMVNVMVTLPLPREAHDVAPLPGKCHKVVLILPQLREEYRAVLAAPATASRDGGGFFLQD